MNYDVDNFFEHSSTINYIHLCTNLFACIFISVLSRIKYVFSHSKAMTARDWLHFTNGWESSGLTWDFKAQNIGMKEMLLRTDHVTDKKASHLVVSKISKNEKVLLSNKYRVWQIKTSTPFLSIFLEFLVDLCSSQKVQCLSLSKW